MPKTDSKGLYSLSSIKGSVIGYLEDKYTRPIIPARVYVFIALKTDRELLLFFPCNDQDLGILSKFRILGLDTLKELNPKIAALLSSQSDKFEPYEIGLDNKMARFIFNNLPIADWYYVIGSLVADKMYFCTEHMGNNGFGEPGLITYEHLSNSKDNGVDGVLVAVPDIWYLKVEAPDVDIVESDEGMDDEAHVETLLGGDI